MFLPVGSTKLCKELHPVLSGDTPGSPGWPKEEPESSKGPGCPTAGTFLPEHCCLTCATTDLARSGLQQGAVTPAECQANPNFHTLLLPAAHSQPFLCAPRAPWLYHGQKHLSFNIQTQFQDEPSSFRHQFSSQVKQTLCRTQEKASQGTRGVMTEAAHDFRPKAQDEDKLLCPELRSISTVSITQCALAAVAISSVLLRKTIPFKRHCS